MEPMDAAWSLLKNEGAEGMFGGGSGTGMQMGIQGGQLTPFFNIGPRKPVDWEAMAEIYGDEAVARAQTASKVLQFGAGANALFSIMNAFGAEGNAPLSNLLSGAGTSGYTAYQTAMSAEPWLTEQAAQWGMSPEEIREGMDKYREKQEDESIDRGIAARSRRTQREKDEEAELQRMAEEQAAAGNSVAVADPTPEDTSKEPFGLLPENAVGVEQPNTGGLTTAAHDEYWEQFV